MQKVVLDVGNCGPDHAAIVSAFRQWFNAEVLQADQWSDARSLLLARNVDLVLVNRKLDIDYSDGIDIIREMKADPQFRAVPVMLVTNYAEHQQAAVAIGAEVGFGKLELRSQTTKSRLERILSASVAGDES